ncbi:MAG: FKBP-type peptidyl-prolyl cis-trans isomerase [Eubacterium sp.]|nr:FKBP-type peptidyl-prolyl cis-trans isomerase [Eubacterium sp.]
MKKFLTVTLSIAAMCALAACGSSKNLSSEATTAMELSTEDYEELPMSTPVEVAASEYVELGEYKNLTVTAEKTEVTDEDVEEEIRNQLEMSDKFDEITDRDTVKEGDYINIDYTTKIDGKAQEMYSSDSEEEFHSKVGNGELNENLGVGLEEDFDPESKVIGAKKGSTIQYDFTFPEDYEDEEMAGKKASLEIKIKAIEQIQEFTDALAKELYDVDTAEEARESVRQEYEEQADMEAEEMGQENMWNQIVANAKMKKDFDKDMIEQEKENLKIENQQFAEYYLGIEVEDYLTDSSGMTMDELAAESLKSQCVQDLLIEAENITVTDEEVEEEMKALSEESGFDIESLEEIEQIYSKEDVRNQLLGDKLFEKLMEYNTIKTVPAAAESEETIEVEE